MTAPPLRMVSEEGALFRMGSFYRCKNRTHFFCYVLEVCAELCDFQGGHRWITQATLLKTAHWAVFALSSATAPQLFESIRPALRRFHVKQKSSVITTLDFLVGAGGFEPPKLKAADLQSVPIGHSGTRPYTVFLQSRTACIYYHSEACLSTAFYSFFGKIRMLDGIVQSRGRP